MENKFKVGDKLQLVRDFIPFKAGDIFEAVDQDSMHDKSVWIEKGRVLCYDNCPVGRVDVNDLYNYQQFSKVTSDVPVEEYSVKHYDTFYHLTDKDIEEGKIKVDAYFVAKQWKVGSKDDSGALFHNLKTIARFGEKNSIDREIKALYNQTLALARIYGVNLE